MSDAYTLIIDGDTYSFADLKIVSAVLTTAVAAPDILELTQKLEDLPDSASDLFPAKEYVTLRENGVTIFSGRVQPRARATRAAIRGVHRIAGGWAELTGRYYAQPWAAGTGAGINSARVALNYDAAAVALVKTDVQIRAAVNWAIAHGAPLALGQVDVGIQVEPEYKDSPTCADVISRMLEHDPSLVAFIDYSTNPVPTFHCVEAAAAFSPEAITHGVGVIINNRSFGSISTVTVARELFTGTFDCQRDYENEITGLIMQVKTQTLQPTADVAPGAERKYLTSWQEVKVPNGAVLGNDGVVPFTFDAADFEGYVGLDVAALLRRQAEVLLASAAQLGWSGSGTLKGQLAPAVPGVGWRLNVANADPAYESMNAVIRTSRRDLLACTNTITWGPPRGLNLNQLVTLALGRRKRTPLKPALRDEQKTGQSDEQSYGWDGGGGNKKGDKDSFPLISAKMWLNVDGTAVARAVHVRGEIVET